MELLFLFLSLPFSLLNYSYGSDIKERETKENHSVITPGEPFGFLFHFFCWLSEGVISISLLLLALLLVLFPFLMEC